MLGDAATTNRAFAALRAQVAAGAAADHLTYEQIERYVEGRSDEPERESVNGHLDGCVRCADEVRDLAEFTTQRITPPAVSPSRPTSRSGLVRWMLVPAAAAAAVVAATIVFRKEDPESALHAGQGAAVSRYPDPLPLSVGGGR